MEQILYNYEIILNLLKGENHLRQIAKELNANHMTVKRALDVLVKENALDIKKQGKNSIFSIKKTLEAQNFVFRAEMYKLNRLIAKHPELKRDIIDLKKIPVNIIILFGSYAKGMEKSKSDIDVYIETQSSKIKRDAAKINRKFSIKIGKYDKKNLLIKEIDANHIIIKGFEAYYEKNKLFEQA